MENLQELKYAHGKTVSQIVSGCLYVTIVFTDKSFLMLREYPYEQGIGTLEKSTVELSTTDLIELLDTELQEEVEPLLEAKCKHEQEVIKESQYSGIVKKLKENPEFKDRLKNDLKI